MNLKKRELSEWEKSECAALKAAIEEYNRVRPKKDRITQEQAGAALGMNQGSFSNYLNGRLAINLDFALKVSKLFDIPVERFSKRLAEEIDAITNAALKPTELHQSERPKNFKAEEYRFLKKPRVHIFREDPDLLAPENFLRISSSLKPPQSDFPTASCAMYVSDGAASLASLVRLQKLVEKLQRAIGEDRITEKDFELFESMLDRLVEVSAPHQRESNEHFEKH
jgi:transcriptional regulator with XRE-family HTH domain